MDLTMNREGNGHYYATYREVKIDIVRILPRTWNLYLNDRKVRTYSTKRHCIEVAQSAIETGGIPSFASERS